MHLESGRPGTFCWLDLAAADLDAAMAFYGGLLGWHYREEHRHGGTFVRARLGESEVGSMYQLRERHLRDAVPSHWLPYVQVADIDAAWQRAVSLGGERIIAPFALGDLARIALIVDAVGAPLGLLEPVRDRGEGGAHG